MTRDTKGKFAPGTSGNPNGRPKVAGKIRDLAREMTPEAIEVLRDSMSPVMRITEPRIALEAAKVILAYAYGKPPQAITGEDGEGPAELIIKWASSE